MKYNKRHIETLLIGICLLCLYGCDSERKKSLPSQEEYIKVEHSTDAKIFCPRAFEQRSRGTIRLSPSESTGEQKPSSSTSISTAESKMNKKTKTVFSPIEHLPFWRMESSLFFYKSAVSSASICFDSLNRPYVLNDDKVITLTKKGELLKLDFKEFIKNKYPQWNGEFRKGDFSESHIVFDSHDNAYMLVNLCRSNIKKIILLYSDDCCRNWKVYSVCSGDADTFAIIEHRDGHSEFKYPPAIVVGTPLHGDKRGLSLFLINNNGDNLTVNKPILLTDNAFCVPIHSGGQNVVISVKDKVYIAWANNEVGYGIDGTGTPQYCRSYNRITGNLSKLVFLGMGGSGKPDNHNIPAITVDSRGFLHILLGAHHDQFKYCKSIKPESVSDGWTEPISIGVPKVGAEGSYTYMGLLCDSNDTLHVVARWAGGGKYKFRLVYLQKKSGAAWSNNKDLVIPFRSGYSCWYQKLTIDRLNRLFVSYVYFGGHLTDEQSASYCQKFPSKRNSWYSGVAGKGDSSILMSIDHGDSWQLVEFQSITLDSAVEHSTDAQTFCPQALTQGTRRTLRVRLCPSVSTCEQKSCTSVSMSTAKSRVRSTCNYTNIENNSVLKKPEKKLSVVPSLQYGGNFNDVDIMNEQLVMAVGSRIVLSNINYNKSVEIVSQSVLQQNNIQCLKVCDNYIYAGVGTNIVTFINKNNKLSFVSKVIGNDNIYKIGVYNNLMLVAHEHGLKTFDITEKGHPVLLSDWRKGDLYDFAIKDGNIFMARGEKGISIFALSSNGRLKFINSLPSQKSDNATSAYSISLSDNLMYIAPAWSGIPIRVMDVSDINNIREISRYKSMTWSWGRKMIVRGKYGYYPAPDAIYVMNLENPSNLTVLKKLSIANGKLLRLIETGNTLCAVFSNEGMGVIDISDPINISVKTSYSEAVCPWGITALGQELFLSDWRKGISCLTISSMGSVQSKGFIAKTEVQRAARKKSFFRVAVGKQYGFIATGIDGLWIMQIGKNGKLKVINKLKFDGGIRDVALNGEYLFVAEEHGGIRVLDISDINNIKTIKVLKQQAEVLSLSLNKNSLFVGYAMTYGEGHVASYDVSDINNINKQMDYITNNDAWGIDIAGDLLYVAEAAGGIRVIDISDLSIPKYCITIALPGSSFDVCVFGDILIAANGDAGLFFVNKEKRKKSFMHYYNSKSNILNNIK